MRKSLLILLFALLGIGFLSAQYTGGGYINAEGVYVEEEEFVIELRDMAPDSGIYKIKLDTFFMSYKYRMELTDECVEEYSEELLNTWLKESK
ncbi:MAG: hypothetical protein LHW60_04840 [Candidatus Cloacimonetes bacterium]|jgi:hypothetical protein|nr:hypothetical protein [Candidatus Cloacimonadota bacterium]NLO43469.1 hypothetical protein [Candidatus Cloacimonadota bacterium]